MAKKFGWSTLILAVVSFAACEALVIGTEGERLKGKSSLPDHILPHFVDIVSNVTVREGKEAVMNCTVKDLGSYKLSWLQISPEQTVLTVDRDVISTDSRLSLGPFTKESQEFWSLHINPVKASDDGWYSCQLNTHPQTIHRIYLAVVAPPEIQEPASSKIEKNEYSSVAMSCNASGRPRPKITWTRDDGEVLYNSRYVALDLREEGELRLLNASRQYSRKYTCTADNGVEPKATKTVRLNLLFPPTVIVQEKNVPAHLGQDLTIMCEVEASPRAVISWTLDDGNVVPRNGIKYKETIVDVHSYKKRAELTIFSVTESDFRAYRCNAKSSRGADSGYVFVHKIDPPLTPQAGYIVKEQRSRKMTSASSGSVSRWNPMALICGVVLLLMTSRHVLLVSRS